MEKAAAIGKSDRNFYKRDTCRLCNSKNVKLVVHLEPTPLADSYIPKEKLNEVQDKYPLDLYLCLDCGHAQLLDVVKPDILFRDYFYVTSSSPGLVEHFRKYSDEIIKRFKPPKGSLVVDVGSNDGSLLKFFKSRGMAVLGIDPARQLAKKATDSGIPTLPNYLTTELSKTIKKQYGTAAIITANNVFAHADDMGDLAKAICNLLSPEGIFVFEVSYLVHIIERMLFDTIYHEHLCYHSVKPLSNFLRKYGMELLDVEYIPTKGGSMRGLAQLAGGPRPISDNVKKLIEMEERLGFDKCQIFEKFDSMLKDKKNRILAMLNDLKSKGKSIAGYGASHTVTTLIYNFELGKLIDFLVDDNPIKQNLYSPGFHIPVFSSDAIYKKNPDYVIVLAWQYAERIMSKHQEYLGQGGHFIIPLPELKIE